MTEIAASARQVELLDAAYRYVLCNGIGELSLRPLAKSIGTSPRVLLYLFGSKEGLIHALLNRARRDQLDLLEHLAGGFTSGVGRRIWNWLVAQERRPLLVLWVEAYGRSLTDTAAPWSDFARLTVNDWLDALKSTQAPATRDTDLGSARRTAVLLVLRGAVLDLLATEDEERVCAAVELALSAVEWGSFVGACDATSPAVEAQKVQSAYGDGNPHAGSGRAHADAVPRLRVAVPGSHPHGSVNGVSRIRTGLHAPRRADALTTSSGSPKTSRRRRHVWSLRMPASPRPRGRNPWSRSSAD